MSRRAAASKRSASPTPPAGNGDGNVGSGFVLKLFQMCNGAPDELVAWLPSGDAFKIQDLERLEKETLPTYFRHKRFQSLVRQLNFYSFRKVNKERTFWVYRHPLFHRDRPEDLHLLRRRTCPGVDGRKNRSEFDISSLEKGAASNLDEQGQPIKKKKTTSTKRATAAKKKATKRSISPTNAVEVTPTPKKKRKSTSSELGSTKKAGIFVSPSLDNGEDSDSSGDEAPVTSRSTKSSCPFGEVSSPSPRQRSVAFGDMSRTINISTTGSGTKTPPRRDNILLQAANLASQNRFDHREQSLLVAEVSQALDEHMKRAKSAAASAARSAKLGRGSPAFAGTVTPTVITDTMKYNALTYDDEIVERDEDVMGIIDKVKVEDAAKAKLEEGGDVKMEDAAAPTTIVTDEESEDDTTPSGSVTIRSDSKTVSPVRSSTYKAIQASKMSRARAKSIDHTSIPVPDPNTVSVVATKLMNGASNSTSELRDRAMLIRFCMSTAPRDPALPDKVWGLLTQCKVLGSEFLRYHSALDPSSSLDLQRGGFGALSKTKLDDTMRDFGVFMVNVVEATILDFKKGVYTGTGSHEEEAFALRKTAEVWRVAAVKPY